MTNTMSTGKTKQTEQHAAFQHPAHSRLILSGGVFGGGRMLVLDSDGFMPGIDARAAHGLWWLDTRHLNRWCMLLNGKPLRLLRANDSKGYAGRFFYSNPAVEGVDGEFSALPEQTIRIRRDIALAGGGVYERINLKNNGLDEVQLRVDIQFGADFPDMFEVRGDVRPQRGETLAPQVDGTVVTLGYRGLDGKLMETKIAFTSAAPVEVQADGAIVRVKLAPKQQADVDVVFSTYLEDAPIVEEHPQPFGNFDDALAAADAAFQEWSSKGAQIEVANERLSVVMQRALRDIYMLRIPTPHGPYIAAGIPWFYDPFGRDGIWVGLQMLPFRPDLACEILKVNAAYQGATPDAWTLEDVGNIVHEVRFGEMSRLKEKPFFRYYGTVDATPLFVVLFCRYVQWTNDMHFARSYWRHVRLALDYINKSAGKGYLAYGHEPVPSDKPAGLSNRDWKDSGDSIMHSNGELAKPPIATCNVQGYLLQAWESASQLASKLGYGRISRTLARKAARLKKSFAGDYWMPDKQYIALALAGTQRRQCDVVSSNPGHLLRSGIIDAAMAKTVAKRMMQPDMFNGWAVRTLAEKEKRYNPDSYQDGSVWWHDNAIICDGMMEIGEVAYAHAIFKGALDAASTALDNRLKELDSGTEREESPEGTVGYPVACDPQAWAAGSTFMMLSACLGLNRRESLQAPGSLCVVAPALPEWLSAVALRNLSVGGQRVDLKFAIIWDGSTACSAAGRGWGARAVGDS